MRQAHERQRAWRRIAYSLGLCATVCATGCQVDLNGQTLPSPYYMYDDIQYFPAGPEFKLSNEAARMKAYTENRLEEIEQ